MKKENYFISVSEPWDFESLDGKNIIAGSILTIKSSKCLIFKSNYLLRFGNIEGFFLILSPRLKGGNFYNKEREVIINGALFLLDFNREYTEHELMENSKFVMIGSLRKEGTEQS
ncbi:hypothetical protein [Flavobacterium sp. ZB4R12]|uniref:hypothetical protein n=1 Tax=Flavobacterium sp. ZB4R12 TaxID=3398732 RepID=UPI003AAD808D